MQIELTFDLRQTSEGSTQVKVYMAAPVPSSHLTAYIIIPKVMYEYVNFKSMKEHWKLACTLFYAS